MEGTPKALQKLRISKHLKAKGSSVLPHEGLGVGGTLGTNEKALWVAKTGQSGKSGMRDIKGFVRPELNSFAPSNSDKGTPGKNLKI